MGIIAKFLTALIAFLGLIVNALPDGITATEWRNIAIGGISALGVYAIPNTAGVARVRRRPPAPPSD